MEFAVNAATNIWSLTFILISILIPTLFSLFLLRVIGRSFTKTCRSVRR